MTHNSSDSFEYPDEAGYPDGTGTLSETQHALIQELDAPERAEPGIPFYVVDNPDAGRYDAISGDTLIGGITYTRAEGVVTLIETFVDPEYRGQGVATELIRRVLDELRAQESTVEVECPIVRAFIRRHGEYRTLTERG